MADLAQVRYQRALLFRKLVDRLGPEVLDVVAEHSIEQTRLSLEQTDIAERNLEAVIRVLWDQLPPEFEYTIDERTPQRLRFNVTRCPIAEEMRQYHTADVGYAFHCASDEGFCQGLNPAIKFTRTKTLMEGDNCCDHTYELEVQNG